MAKYIELEFLQNKICKLESALFFSQHDSVLKLATAIVYALKVDEFGQIWFFLNRPSQCLQEFDRQFPARLDFFKKGSDFFLKIIGKAYIVNDPEEINSIDSLPEEMRKKAMDQLVLIRLKIGRADYFERKIEKHRAGMTALVNNLYNFLFDAKLGQEYSMDLKAVG